MTDEPVAADDAAQAAAQVFTGVAHPARIRILHAVVAAEAMPDVADELGMSRSGLQTHITRLLEADLLRRTPDATYPYAVTPLGELVHAFLASYEDVLADAVAMTEAAEQEAAEEFEGVPLSNDTFNEAVQTRKWDLVLDDLTAELADAIDALSKAQPDSSR